MPRIVIYTDLDGSLLDHYSYSHAAADALLEDLEAQSIPVIPASSKTRVELLALRRELGNCHPFIVENGAAVLIPAGYFSTQPADTTIADGFWLKRFSPPRSHWLEKLKGLSHLFAGQFTGFADLELDDIISLTGLTPEAATLAVIREYGEPVRWLGSDAERRLFIERLQKNGAQVLEGGRFMHISGDCDKGRALEWLHTLYRQHYPDKPVLSVAVGDSHNDKAMLEAADHALIVRSPKHAPPVLSRSDHTLISQSLGPEGWSEGIGRILQSLNLTRSRDHG